MELSIIEVTKDQFSEIWPFFEEVIRAGETYPFPMDTDEKAARDFWFAPHAKVYNAYLDGRCVASRYIVPNKPGLGSHVCNTGVVIDKAVRGQGLGYQMMEFALQKTKELGFKAIQLNLVASNNHASLKICRSVGFETIGTLKSAFHYRAEEYIDAHVMYKTL